MNNKHSISSARRFRYIAFSIWMTLSISAWAGPGHDHGDETPSSTIDTQAPRFTLQNEHLEAVGIVRENRLLLYVDRHDTNEPLSPKTLDLTVNNTPVEMTQKAEGFFEGQLPNPIPHSEHPVQLKVGTEERTETLTTTWSLETHDEEPSASEENKHSHQTLLFGVIGILLAVIGTLTYKTIQKTRSAS